MRVSTTGPVERTCKKRLDEGTYSCVQWIQSNQNILSSSYFLAGLLLSRFLAPNPSFGSLASVL